MLFFEKLQEQSRERSTKVKVDECLAVKVLTSEFAVRILCHDIFSLRYAHTNV